MTTVERHAHLAAAAYLMRRAGDTAVVITSDDENRRPIGIITDVDITDVVADGKEVNDVRIEQLIGPDPMTVQSDTTVNEAAEPMLSAGIHHLPVVDNDHLIGIVDISDACRSLLDATLVWRGDVHPRQGVDAEGRLDRAVRHAVSRDNRPTRTSSQGVSTSLPRTWPPWLTR